MPSLLMNPENMQSKRPTPETDEEERIDNGETQPILEFARRLERERDEAREELKATRKLMEDANRGAEWDAHINNSLAGKLNEAQKEIKAMLEAIKEAHEALMLAPYRDYETIAKLQPFLA